MILTNRFLMDEEDEPKADKKEENAPGFLNKKMEQIFFEKRSIYLWGQVDDKSAKDIVTKLLLLDADKPGAEINFYINSPGGVVTAGMSIYDTMQFIKPDVSTIVMGQACSMGSLLATAGAPGKRMILPNARHMIHQPSGGAGGQATDMQIQVNEILKMKKNLTEIYVHHNSKGKTFDELSNDMERDNFMSAQEAVDYGLVDEIISKR